MAADRANIWTFEMLCFHILLKIFLYDICNNLATVCLFSFSWFESYFISRTTKDRQFHKWLNVEQVNKAQKRNKQFSTTKQERNKKNGYANDLWVQRTNNAYIIHSRWTEKVLSQSWCAVSKMKTNVSLSLSRSLGFQRRFYILRSISHSSWVVLVLLIIFSAFSDIFLLCRSIWNSINHFEKQYRMDV